MDELGDMMVDEEEEEARASQIPAPSAPRKPSATSPRAPMGSQARFKAREKERQERITQRETLGRVGPSRSLEQENVVDTTEANENDFTWDPTIDMDPELMEELDAPAERPFASTSKDARRQALSDVEMEEERKPEMSDNDGEVVDDWDDDSDDDEGALGPTQYDINSKYRPLFD